MPAFKRVMGYAKIVVAFAVAGMNPYPPSNAWMDGVLQTPGGTSPGVFYLQFETVTCGKKNLEKQL